MPAGPNIPKELTLQPGATFSLEVPRHGVGGYVWSARVLNGNARVTEAAESTAIPARIGGGTALRYTITAPEEGSSVVRFTYGRSWEGDPLETHDITVRVER